MIGIIVKAAIIYDIVSSLIMISDLSENIVAHTAARQDNSIRCPAIEK